jgi:hypothetical protein
MVVLGDKMRRSPAEFDQLKPGDYSVRVMLAGYEPEVAHFEIEADAQTKAAPLRLLRSVGGAELISRPAGAAFEIRQGDALVRSGTTPATLADLPTGDYQLAMKIDTHTRSDTLEIRRGEVTTRDLEFASGLIKISSHPPGAEILVDGQPAGRAPLEIKSFEGEHVVVAKYRAWPEQRLTLQATQAKPIMAEFEFPHGSVKITSAPGGASVWQGNRELGRTPLPLDDLEPGEVRYELRLAGYKNIEVMGKVQPGEQTFLPARFVKRLGPRRGEPWENSLGIKFLPVGDILMGIWPVRVQDYEAFCTAEGRARSVPDFAQDATHPVVRVSWEDATAFCAWLTQKEIKAGLIEEGQSYRLPTDLEWSAGDCLPPEGQSTPEERDGKFKDFPWGKQWPPPPRSGNFADGSGRKIAGYQDGFPQTSPVGSFPANRLGLFDMTGNVWQWCRDSYKGGATTARDWGVMRGGSWGTATASELRSSYRNVVDRAERDVIYGFRCVLVPESDP